MYDTKNHDTDPGDSHHHPTLCFFTATDPEMAGPQTLFTRKLII